jgi:DNA-binding Lrp family transcriptional regulator
MAGSVEATAGAVCRGATFRDPALDVGEYVPDAVDLLLIESLRRDGRETNRALASRLGVSEVTVASRLRRLEETGRLRVTAVTDIRLFGHSQQVFALIDVAGRSAYHVAHDLARIPETMSVTVCTGRFDVVATLLGRDRRHVAELFGTALPSIPGVIGIHGSIALDVVKFDSSWALFGVDDVLTPGPQPTEAVDELDLAIIGLLQVNGRRSNRELATRLGVSEGTVRGRIKAMLAQQVFRIQAVCDLATAGMGAHAVLGIEASPGDVDALAQALALRVDVPHITRVLHGFDLIAVMIASDRDALVRTVADEIMVLPGLMSVQTLVSAGTVKHAYGWTWIV